MLSGECFCGEIGYEISGEVFDARCCHCSRCRKAFSGSGSAYGLVRPEEFSWTRGTDLLQFYGSEDNAGLQFCGKCGSTLCGLFAGEVHGVTLGCLNGDPPLTIARHIFTGSKASWDHIGGDAQQYDQWPTGDEA